MQNYKYLDNEVNINLNELNFTAMLSGTLKTYQKTACDFEKIQLACPRGTSITIEQAQYKKPSPGKTKD